METLLAIIILLGFFTLFGWKGLTIIGKILGFIGAGVIILAVLWLLGLDITDESTWGFLGVVFLLMVLIGGLAGEPSEEDLKKRKEIYEKIRQQLKEEKSK